MKHYKRSTVYQKGSKDYTGYCGQGPLAHKNVTQSLQTVDCPECMLDLMTDYENKIAILEHRYEELFPNRPVGEKIQ